MAFNTTTYTGETGRVEFDVGGSLTSVASVRSFSIDLNTETIEDTDMSSGGNRTYKAGLTDFSGTMDLYMRDSDEAQQASRTQGSAPATIKLFPSGETTGATLTGEVLITGFSISSSFDGMVEATASFQGTGGLTIAATS